MIVMKFGGTSVQDEEAIGRVISIVRSRLSEKPLVVVSDLARVTRLLCAVADEAGQQNEDNLRRRAAFFHDHQLCIQCQRNHLPLDRRQEDDYDR